MEHAFLDEVPVAEGLKTREERPDFCEMCKAELPVSGYYELRVMRGQKESTNWRFDRIACVKEFAVKYSKLDIVLEPDDDEGENYEATD